MERRKSADLLGAAPREASPSPKDSFYLFKQFII